MPTRHARSKPADSQKHQGHHIERAYKARGVPAEEAHERARNVVEAAGDHAQGAAGPGYSRVNEGEPAQSPRRGRR